MPIQFQCSSCQLKLKVPDTSAGKQAKCKCGAILKIPMASTLVTQAPAAASGGGSSQGTAQQGAAKPATAPKPAQASSKVAASASAKASNANMNSLFDELTEKDWTTKEAPVPKKERGGQSDGAFLKAYAASEKSLAGGGAGGNSVPGAERTRNEHLGHEKEIKAIGFLYSFSGVLNLIACIFIAGFGVYTMIVGPGNAAGDPQIAQAAGILGVVFLVAGLVGCLASGFTLFLGMSMMKLAGWSRYGAIVFAFLGLPGFPIGTLISVYMLVIYFSQKGKHCFTPEYRKVVAATPEIPCPLPVWVWILVGLSVMGLVMGVVSAALAM